MLQGMNFEQIQNIVTPPRSWRITHDDSEIVLDGEWKFPLSDTSKDPLEMYIYKVMGHPDLLKIGISKNSKKRLEKYYGKMLWQKSFDRRTAKMVEYLFMHSTYHRSHYFLPLWNVGNFFYDTALPKLKRFYNLMGHNTPGITEVRQLTLVEAEKTINYVSDLLLNGGVFEAISECGIRTFARDNYPPSNGRSTVIVKRGMKWNQFNN